MRVFTYCTHLTRLTLGLFCAFFGTHYSTWSATNQRAQGHYPLEFPGDPQVPDTLPVFKTPGHCGIHTSSGHDDVPYSQQNERFTKIQPDPTKDEVFIYFPVDGHQPTTEQAAHWSQANTDNDPNSPITKWYMRMFGWTDPNNTDDVELKMGFGITIGQEQQPPNKIINLGSSMLVDTEVDMEKDGRKITRAEAFWGNLSTNCRRSCRESVVVQIAH